MLSSCDFIFYELISILFPKYWVLFWLSTYQYNLRDLFSSEWPKPKKLVLLLGVQWMLHSASIPLVAPFIFANLEKNCKDPLMHNLEGFKFCKNPRISLSPINYYNQFQSIWEISFFQNEYPSYSKIFLFHQKILRVGWDMALESCRF